jgi:hypothetical protein
MASTVTSTASTATVASAAAPDDLYLRRLGAHLATPHVAPPPLAEVPHVRTPHPDHRPTRPRARALPPGRLVAAVALAPLLVASCTDSLTASCPPLAHPPVLTVAAASNPCAARAGEAADLLALRVVKTYQRTEPPRPGLPTKYPLRCGNTKSGYVHLLDERAHGNYDHGDPANDPEFDAEIAFAVEHGAVVVQNNNNLQVTVRYDDVQRTCHSNRWGFRVILATNVPLFPPPGWRPDGLPVGVITAFRLSSQPSS